MRAHLIYKYISKKFWGPFCFALGVFAALVMLGDTFEKMKSLNNGVATIWDVLTYSMLTFPNWLTTIMPVACLLASISVISEMVSNGEWTACIAGGFSPRQLFKPVIACILMVVAATMLLQEFIVPPLLAKSENIYYTRLKPTPGYNQTLEPNVIIKVAPTQMLFAKMVDLSQGTMTKVSLDTYNSEWDIAEQIVAEQMVWDNQADHWLFVNGLIRTFTGPTNTSEKHFEKEAAPLSIRPDQMSVSQVDEKLMSIRDLSKRIRFHKQTGISSYSAETVRQSKLATPFATVIMCLLGMPFAISSKRKSKILNIIASMVIAFAFWSFISMCTAIGVNGYVNPFIAGWGPVAFFTLVVFFEFKWMRL
uniref:LPS export ABC transporter permease LptG n=1 Tax=uncultured Elusimicrobia bacterium TaxID=699876 RepID=A0A650EPH0_9BACT|nr:LPS export ABC transporter permease LptG [uncultured Elusimicrobia bacterium]